MKNTITTIALLPVTALLLVSGASQAGDSLFKSLDANNDSLLTMDEAKSTPELLESWKLIDANEDSKISSLELDTYMNSPVVDEAVEDAALPLK